MTHILVVENLEYRYGSLQVLKELSCQLLPGQAAMLIGQNGAGKSTFLRCLAGWSIPYKGNITVNNVSLDHDERLFRRQIILVPDAPDFYDELTVWEHLQFISQLYQVSDSETHSEQLLEQFNLFESRNVFPFTLSRGMRYKLALCLALLAHPPLLLLDEPFGPLDAVASEGLWQIFKEYIMAGGSVLFSSHTLPTHHHPDIIFHLHHGQISTIQPDSLTDLRELLRNVS